MFWELGEKENARRNIAPNWQITKSAKKIFAFALVGAHVGFVWCNACADVPLRGKNLICLTYICTCKSALHEGRPLALEFILLSVVVGLFCFLPLALARADNSFPKSRISLCRTNLPPAKSFL